MEKIPDKYHKGILKESQYQSTHIYLKYTKYYIEYKVHNIKIKH